MVNDSFFSVHDDQEQDGEKQGEADKKDKKGGDSEEWTYGDEGSSTCHSIIDLNMQNYMTLPRTKIDFFSIKNYLKQKEIPCIKYNYSLDKEIQNSDQYFATLQLSKDSRTLYI